MVEALGLSLSELPPQQDESSWPAMRERFAAIFATRTRDEWEKLLQPLETCFAPVLTLAEALEHRHNVARSSFVADDGVLQPAPAPRFDRTAGRIAGPAAKPGEHTETVLRDWGFDVGEIAELARKHVIVQLGVE
jgi:alpha-methylacyl-CoA racemase